MDFMKKRWVWILVTVAIVIGVGIFLRARSLAGKERLEAVTKGPAVEAIYAIGKVEATRTFQAKAGVASGIERIPVREGMVVKKGDLIVAFSEGNTVRAPFDGIVTRVEYKVGESVFAGNLIAEVIDPSEYELRVVLDQRAAVKVRRGQKAKLSFDGLRDQELFAEVRTIYTSSSQFTVTLDTKGLPKEILPGMSADVSIEVAVKPEVVLIPAASLQAGKVERVRAGRRQMLEIKTGLVNADKVEVVEGDIIAGDQVVVRLK